jgi:hypothetical protein
MAAKFLKQLVMMLPFSPEMGEPVLEARGDAFLQTGGRSWLEGELGSW